MTPNGDRPTGARFGIDYDGMYEPWVAHRARLLDPSRAERVADDEFGSTLYVADRVLLNTTPGSAAATAFAATARELGFEVRFDQHNAALYGRAAEARPRRPADLALGTARPAGAAAGTARRVDAWALIQEYRARSSTYRPPRAGSSSASIT